MLTKKRSPKKQSTKKRSHSDRIIIHSNRELTPQLFQKHLNLINEQFHTVCHGKIQKITFDIESNQYKDIWIQFGRLENEIISFICGHPNTEYNQVYYINYFCSNSITHYKNKYSHIKGSDLLEYIFNKLRKKYLYVTLKASLPGLIPYYEKFGFQRKALWNNQPFNKFGLIDQYDDDTIEMNPYKLSHINQKCTLSEVMIETQKGYANNKYQPLCWLSSGYFMVKKL